MKFARLSKNFLIISSLMSVNSSISHPRLTRGSYTSYFTLQISNKISNNEEMKIRSSLFYLCEYGRREEEMPVSPIALLPISHFAAFGV